MNRIIISIFCAAVALSLVSCGGKQQASATVEKKQLRVKVEKAVKETVDQLIVFTGIVEAQAVNSIAPQSPRRISKLMADVGDHVSKGQTLVSLDESSLIQARAQLENAKTEYERTSQLYEFGGASRSEWDSRRLQYEVAQATYDNLLENTTLVSPIDGVISERNYDIGDMTGSNPVFKVEQIRPVKILVGVTERLFKSIRKGMKVYLEVDAYDGEKFEGNIYRIYPTIDEKTHTFLIEVRLENRNERLRPGMFGRVTIPYAKADHVVVSDLAVQKLMGSGDRYVYIYEPETSTVRFSKIEYGRRMNNRFEILSGIKEGELVVTEGLIGLTNGASVELKNE